MSKQQLDNPFARKEVLTRKIIEKIKVSDILYAELSTNDGFGGAGAGRLYTLSGECYYCDKPSDNESLMVSFLLDQLLEKARKSKKICYADGGFGHEAYKNKEAIFEASHKDCGFVYTDNDGKQSIIYPSRRGVYLHILADFVYGGITDKTLEQLARNAKNFNPDEVSFLDALMSYYKTGRNDISLEDYMNAIVYIRHLNLMDSHYDYASWISKWRDSFAKYRLRYILDKIKINRLNNVLVCFDAEQAKPGDLFGAISKELGEDVSKLFATYTIEKRDEFNVYKLDNLRYPVVIDMPKAAHEKTVARILDIEPDRFNYAYSLGQYFMSCVFNLDKLELATVLPAAFYFLRNMPMQSYSSMDVQTTFWAASELVNTAWKIIDEPETPKRFEKELYETFWEKIGDLWPIKHYAEFKFCLPDGKDNENADYMFGEALGYVVNIKNIEDYNPELKEFLLGVKEDKYGAAVWTRAVELQLSNLSDEEALEKMYCELDEYGFSCCYPTSIKRAELIFKDILDGEDWRLEDYSYTRLWFAVISGMKKLGVGKRLVELTVENFDKMRENLGDDDMIESFYAFCNEPEVDMLPALTALKDKVVEISGTDQKVLDSVLKYAGEEIKKVAFQRESLQEAYGKPAVARKKVREETTETSGDLELSDDIFRAAAQLALKYQKLSTAILQRNLRIGYGRAAAIEDFLEQLGVIGPALGGNKPREILIESIEEYDEKVKEARKNYE